MAHGDLSEYRLVVIEPDLQLRNMIMKILRDAGAQRTEAFNGVPQAVPYLREATVDGIICEMDQAPVDGTGFAAALRAGKIRANFKTPLILIGGSVPLERVKEAVRAGANNILVKPFSAADLVRRVQKTLGH